MPAGTHTALPGFSSNVRDNSVTGPPVAGTSASRELR